MPLFFDESKTQGRTSLPVTTVLLVAFNVVVFVLTHTARDPDAWQRYSMAVPFLTLAVARLWPFSLIPMVQAAVPQANFAAGELLRQVADPLPVAATLFTHMFMHFDVGHIAGNMSFFLVFGRRVEHELGSMLYLPFILVCGVLAAMGYWLGNIGAPGIFLGMSGAIAGVMGGQLVLYRGEKVMMGLPAFLFIGKFVFDQWYMYAVTPDTNVAFLAHLAGFLAGAFLIGPFMLLRRFTKRRDDGFEEVY